MPRLFLRVEPPDAAPFEREWDERELTIGRAPSSTIVLSDSRVSRNHARLVADGDDQWTLQDLGARNGTVVNGQPVDGSRRVHTGDVLKCGDTVIRILAPAQAAAAKPVTDARRLGSSIVRPAAELLERHERVEHISVDDARRHAARMKAVNDVHKALASVTTTEALLALLLDQLFVTLQPEEGAVLLKDGTGTVAVAANRRVDARLPPSPVSSHLVQEVVDKRAAALVLDVAEDDRFADARSVVASGIRSMVAAPMADADGCFGMIALYSRAHVKRFGEADLELLVALAAAAALRMRNLELAEDAAARRALERELALAREIQMAMLPRGMPALPGVDVAAALHPARAVGGDLYDLVVLGDTLWFIVADAAGKGVSAALYMAVMRALFRAFARSEASPASLLSRINAEIAHENERQFFVTAIVGCLHVQTGALVYASAGHLPPIFLPSRGEPRELDPARTIALGIVDAAPYGVQEIALAPGDRMLFFTDGITEAVDASGELFTAARLKDAAARCGPVHTHALVDAVLEAVREFAGETPQEDDITVLAIQRVPIVARTVSGS